MPASDEYVPDWRDAAAYAPLLAVGRAGFAWEWLRRDHRYRDAAAHGLESARSPRTVQAKPADSAAAPWGLHAFEPPDRDAIAARPMWRRELFPNVLEARAAEDGKDCDRLDIEKLGALVTLVAEPGGPEHLLLSDGCRAVRVDIISGTLRAGPALLRYHLGGLRRVEEPLLVLRQLVALGRTGKFSSGLHPRERRAGRWILLLRTHDALASGASQRGIAEILLGLKADERRWRIEASSVRSRAQRLVREARRMAAGGYLSLLRGR